MPCSLPILWSDHTAPPCAGSPSWRVAAPDRGLILAVCWLSPPDCTGMLQCPRTLPRRLPEPPGLFGGGRLSWARQRAGDHLRSAMSQHSAITGWGMSVPEKILTNAALERIVDTSDEWITSRTGIKQRHAAAPGETASTLSIAAARQALEHAGLARQERALII